MTLITPEIKKYIIIKVVPFVLLIIWLIAIFSPLLEPISKSFSIISLLFMKMISSVCHQDHDKSVLLGKHIYVCARCAGIYVGSFLCALILIFGVKINIKNLKLLSITSILLLADVLSVNLGLYDYSHTIAFCTGLLFGLIIYQYLVETIEYFISKRILTT